MSEPNIPDTSKDEQDPIKQVKAEFSRKHKDTTDTLNQIVTTQAALQAAIEKLAQPKAPVKAAAEEEPLEELMYSDPKAYAKRIKDEAMAEALAVMRQETNSKSSVDQTIAALANEYPELADQGSDLTKASVEILKTMSDSDKMSGRTYEYAVMKAAAQLDVKPKSKRPTVEDDFVAPSYQSPQARSKKRTTDAVVNQNKDIAAQFGLNLDDPKTKEQYVKLLKSKGAL